MPTPCQWTFGPFRLDLEDERLWRGTEVLPLRQKTWTVLCALVMQAGHLMTKEALLAAGWPEAAVSESVLTGVIRELRQALGEQARHPQWIETVHGRGYRFSAAVAARPEPLAAPVAPASSPPSAPSLPTVAPAAPTAAAFVEEYKLVTILCGALAAAPPLEARLGPEGLYRLLHTVVGLVQEVLQPYGGTLTLATSAGFTALFGAPVAQEDHARRAVLAAMELCQRLPASPTLQAVLGGGVLALRLGLHSGLVVVGGLGQAPRQMATAVGAPFDVATRLQQQAAPGTILLSTATYALVHADVRAVPCGTLTLDGPSSQVPLYVVQGRLRRQAGVAGHGPRTVSPWRGRERELGRLHDHLAAARAGQGQIVGVVGEPGMGKTRLLTEFCRSLAEQPVTVYVGQCLAYGQAIPYLPVRTLVQQLCGGVEGDPPARHTAAVQQRLHASGITAEADGTLLCQLLDLPVDLAVLAAISPQGRQARTFALLRHLVQHAAQQQPLVLVVEDLHWSDPTSDAWLASLGERLGGMAVLLLGTYRPGYHPAWGAHAAVTQMAITPLPVQDSRAVVQTICGALPLPETRLRTLVARAAGNPFFLEELAWHTREQGGMDTSDAVPATIHAVLAARIDRLPSEAKRLLQIAAVIGLEVSLPVLQAIAALPEEALERSLAHLQAAEFLYETRLFPDHAYAFRHALTHEVAYSSLLWERRRVLHARIVEEIEGCAGAQGAEQVEHLAYHALQGEMWGKAFAYLRQAGSKAATRSANREVVMHLTQALHAARLLPDHCDTTAQVIDVRFELQSAYLALGELERVLDHLGEAQRLAETLGDHRRLGRVSAHMIFCCWWVGEPDRALEAGDRALATASVLEDVALRTLTQFRLGQVYSSLGEYRRAIDLFTQVVQGMEGTSLQERFGLADLPAVTCRDNMSVCLAQLGDFAAAHATAAAAIQVAQAADHPYSLALAYRGAGAVHVSQGNFAHAIPLLERSLDLSRGENFTLLFPLVAAHLGRAYTLSGRVAEGLELLQRVVAQSATLQLMVSYVRDLTWLSEAYLLLGQPSQAMHTVQQALPLLRAHQGRGLEAEALRIMADTHAAQDPPAVAEAAVAYQEALRRAEALGMRPLQAHCHRGLGILYARGGQQARARPALSTAITLYRAMAMTFWLPQTEAALAQVDVR